MIKLTIGGKTKRSANGQYDVELDWENLPSESRDFVIHYGLKQYLADGAAGATSRDEMVAGVDERVRKLREADFTRRTGEAKPDSETTRAIKLAKAAIRAAAKAKGVNPPSGDKMAEMAARLVESNPQYRKDAAKQLEAERKAAEAFAGDDTMQDLLAELAGAVDTSNNADDADEDDDTTED